MSHCNDVVVKTVLQAAQAGHLDVIQVAIRDHDSQDHEISMCRNKSGDTPLLLAARHGHLAVLKFLTEEVALSLQQTNLDHKNALHEAAQSSHLECVRYLLNHGVPVDALKRADWTPLMLACTKSSMPVVAELVAAGADCSLCNKDGWTPFHVACREDNKHIVEFLLNRHPGAWDTRSKNGRTPLHTAALHCRTDVVQLLLARCQYATDDADSCGVTPLMDAARACASRTHFPILDLLIGKQHASVGMRDSLGRAAIHHAAQNGCAEAVCYLVERYASDPWAASSVHAMTPLHYAAKEGQLGVARNLVNLGVDVTTTDFKGRTALHMAAIGRHEEVIRFLRVDCDAEDVADSSGQTPSFFLKNRPALLALFSPS